MKKIFLFLILSLVVSGCFNQKADVKIKKSENNNISNEIKDYKQDIANEVDKNENLSEADIFTDNTEGTENWRIYEKKDQNVRIKYHKNWYYDRDEELEKKLGYDLYVGFAESPEILAQGAPYPLEFIISAIGPAMSESTVNLKIIAERENKDYILITSNKNKYQNILDKMAESFEFIDE